MIFQKRQRKILELVENLGDVEVQLLSAELGTSDMTIRRDLNQMAAEGLIVRTHGGAMKVEDLTHKTKFENKAAVNLEAKDAICKLAANEIKDGDIIFMDCGSTVFRLCQFIKDKSIKVITNSLPVVAELLDSRVSINLIGGEVNPERKAVHGTMAAEHIARYHATKAFLGVDGISDNGLFANSENEASITSAYAAQSALTYLLCDSSKINRQTYLKFAELSLANVVITNQEDKLLDVIRKKGIKVLVAGIEP